MNYISNLFIILLACANSVAMQPEDVGAGAVHNSLKIVNSTSKDITIDLFRGATKRSSSRFRYTPIMSYEAPATRTQVIHRVIKPTGQFLIHDLQSSEDIRFNNTLLSIDFGKLAHHDCTIAIAEGMLFGFTVKQMTCVERHSESGILRTKAEVERLKKFETIKGLRTALGISPTAPIDDYAVLGLSPDATRDQVRKAYTALTLKWHPDRAENKALAHEVTSVVRDAYERLEASHSELGSFVVQ